jgi:penicillin-binding protein 1A
MKYSGKTRRNLKWFWSIVITPFALLFVLIILINWDVFGHMPTFEDLENPQSKLATEIISEDGILLGTYHIENRSHTSYEELSSYLVKALVSTEDARFSNHSGIDFIGLGRVFFKTVLGGNKRAGGGSTITQQLALNLFAERDPNIIKRSIQKLQEWVTAVKLERNYTKSEIIAMYLNTVPFGSNAFGIRSAAQTFFGKLPSQLNLEESALMVGVVNAPTWYSPVRNPERSLGRRNVVLGQMLKYGYITRDEFDSVKLIPIRLDYAPVDHNTGLATYFREMLRQIMRAQKPDKSNYGNKPIEEFVADSIQWETNPLYGWCNKNLRNGKPYDLDRDGLKIYTTINSQMQKYAEDAVIEHLSTEVQPNFDKQKKLRKRFPFSNLATEEEVNTSIQAAMRNTDRYRKLRKAGASKSEINKSFETPVEMTIFTWKGDRDTIMTPLDSIWYYKSLLRASMIAMEPHTGSVRAYVGGHNFRYFKYDNAWQGRRQVGSTIKPFLYTLAMMEGMSPCDKVINNRQVVILPDGTTWSPETSEGDKYLGQEVTLKWGLTRSSNNISAWLIQRISPSAMVDLCRRMGITSFMDPVPSICLGSDALSPLEMVSAYNTYPSKGIHVNPFFVTRIEDNNGNVLATFTQSKQEVINQQTAYLMINMMQGVVNEGTGARVRRYMPTGEVAGKTGTTNKNSDGWFIGYTPKLTTGIWVGNEDNKSYLLGDGARMALPIWGLFMQKILANQSLNIRNTDKFEVPPGMEAYNLGCTGADTDGDGGSEESEEIFF